MDWSRNLGEWVERFGCSTLPPLADGDVANMLQALGAPNSLGAFYVCTNGLRCSWLQILPLEDLRHIKKTWDSLQRANDPTKTRFLGGSEELLARFLIIGTVGANDCAAIDRADERVWYEEEGSLKQTNLDFEGFVQTCLREIAEGI